MAIGKRPTNAAAVIPTVPGWRKIARKACIVTTYPTRYPGKPRDFSQERASSHS
jgi:hypothetical protein